MPIKWIRFIAAVKNNLTHRHNGCSKNACKCDHHNLCRLLQQRTCTSQLPTICAILNSGAKLIVRQQTYDHIKAALKDELHGLPVPQLLEYKLCLFDNKCLHQMAPSYLVKIGIAVDRVERHRHLWSAGLGDLVVPRSKSKTYDPRA